MAGTFFGFNTALRGMQAQQRGIYTTSHNIANANTEGYTRQRTVMETTFAYPVPAMNRPGGGGWQIGTGVDIQETRRLRDEFLDRQLRYENGTLGLWQQRHHILQQVEVVFNEPSDTGLNTLFGQFWDSWQELAKYAESAPVRTTVTDTAKTLAEALNHSAAQLETIKEDIDQIIELKVIEINSLARQVVDLNKQIKNIVQAGDQPNDLFDRRDLLLDQLSEIIDFKLEANIVTIDDVDFADGQVKILIGDEYLVDIDAVTNENQINELVSAADGEIQWSSTAAEVDFNSGEIKGLQAVREDVLTYLEQLDILARGLAENVNAIHSQGYDLGGKEVAGTKYENFFVAYSIPPSSDDTDASGITAQNIGINLNLRGNESKIAAAATDAGGGAGDNALKIVQLRHKLFAVEDGTLKETAGGVTFDDYYKNFTARLGVEAHEASRMVTNQETLLDQLDNRKEAISGVSLDEEMANMIQYQRAYQAAARMITTLDSMLDKIINGMGASR